MEKHRDTRTFFNWNLISNSTVNHPFRALWRTRSVCVCVCSPWQGCARVRRGSQRPARGSQDPWWSWHLPECLAFSSTSLWQHQRASRSECRQPSHYSPLLETHWFLKGTIKQAHFKDGKDATDRVLACIFIAKYVYLSIYTLPRSSGVCSTEWCIFSSSCRSLCWTCSAVSVAGDGVCDREPPRECIGDALSEPEEISRASTPRSLNMSQKCVAMCHWQ